MSSLSTLQPAPTGSVPFAMTNPLRVPRERYYDRTFYELEKQKVWYKSWLMACRLEEIPEPNDYVEFEVCDQSVIIVRQVDMSVKAFHNACRHRATQLAKGSGTLDNGQFTCPFHGWRWKTDGSPSFLYGAKGFAPECMKPDDLKLRECKSDVWGAHAWINLDPDAGPLMDTLQPAAQMLDEVAIGNMRVKWWREVILNCNWKIGLEAFLEGWHVKQTHPQETFGLGDNFPPDGADYRVHPNGHSSVDWSPNSTTPDFDVILELSQILVDGQDAMVLDRDMHVLEGLRNKLKPGDDIRAAIATAMRDHNEGAGIPMPEGVENSPLWWAGEVFMFPNYVMLPMYGNCLVYRFRPYNDDPEWCRFEIWSLTTYPESYPVERARLEGRYDKEDEQGWGLIPRQDFSNMERQQRGLHSLSYESHRLATVWENSISNYHQEIDRRIAAP